MELRSKGKPLVQLSSIWNPDNGYEFDRMILFSDSNVNNIDDVTDIINAQLNKTSKDGRTIEKVYQLEPENNKKCHLFQKVSNMPIRINKTFESKSELSKFCRKLPKMKNLIPPNKVYIIVFYKDKSIPNVSSQSKSSQYRRSSRPIGKIATSLSGLYKPSVSTSTNNCNLLRTVRKKKITNGFNKCWLNTVIATMYFNKDLYNILPQNVKKYFDEPTWDQKFYQKFYRFLIEPILIKEVTKIKTELGQKNRQRDNKVYPTLTEIQEFQRELNHMHIFEYDNSLRYGESGYGDPLYIWQFLERGIPELQKSYQFNNAYSTNNLQDFKRNVMELHTLSIITSDSAVDTFHKQGVQSNTTSSYSGYEGHNSRGVYNVNHWIAFLRCNRDNMDQWLKFDAIHGGVTSSKIYSLEQIYERPKTRRETYVYYLIHEKPEQITIEDWLKKQVPPMNYTDEFIPTYQLNASTDESEKKMIKKAYAVCKMGEQEYKEYKVPLPYTEKDLEEQINIAYDHIGGAPPFKLQSVDWNISYINDDTIDTYLKNKYGDKEIIISVDDFGREKDGDQEKISQNDFNRIKRDYAKYLKINQSITKDDFDRIKRDYQRCLDKYAYFQQKTNTATKISDIDTNIINNIPEYELDNLIMELNEVLWNNSQGRN